MKDENTSEDTNEDTNEDADKTVYAIWASNEANDAANADKPISFECAVCHKVETEGDMFDLGLFQCVKCGIIFHDECIGIEFDSPLDDDYNAWLSDETDVTMDREALPERFCPICRMES